MEGTGERRRFWLRHAGIVAGALLYVLPYNLITTPMGLYSGYLTGIAQIIRTILGDFLHVRMSFDWTGIILYAMNIPLLILAYRVLGRKFFGETVFTITLVALFFSVIPVTEAPVVADRLTGCLTAGVVSGFGGGLILRCGSSCGGLDIVGMAAAKKNPNFGVGQVSLFVAAVVFAVCAVLYDFEVVVYSAVFTVVCSFALDRAHYQNVKMQAVIVTKSEYVGDLLTCAFGRSATFWTGEGAFSHEPYRVYMAAVSRYEAVRLKRKVAELDPNAFIVFQEIREIAGHYESHL